MQGSGKEKNGDLWGVKMDWNESEGVFCGAENVFMSWDFDYTAV